jgi:hypothetical protein
VGDETPQEISNFQGLCSFVNLWEGNICVRPLHQLQVRFQLVYDEIVTEGGANASFQLMALPGIGGSELKHCV